MAILSDAPPNSMLRTSWPYRNTSQSRVPECRLVRFGCGGCDRHQMADPTVITREGPVHPTTVSRTSSGLRSAAGWIVVTAAAYAPLAFGSVSPRSIRIMNTSLFVALALWSTGLVLARRSLPPIPRVLLVSAGVLLALGWFMTWNARAAWLPGTGMVGLHPPFPKLPGSFEQTVSLLTMIRLSALLAALLITAGLARQEIWRQRFIHSVAVFGALIALIGLAQSLGWRSVFARYMNPQEGAFFATFNYHGNAGAYLNLALPLLAGLWIGAVASPGTVLRRVTLSAMLVVTLAAAAVNTSRGAQAITVVLVSVMAVWGVLCRCNRPASFSRPSNGVLVSLIGMSVLLVGIGLFGIYRNLGKWRLLPLHVSEVSSRRQVWRVSWPMALSAGPLGHGPGTFKMLLPRSPLLGPAFWRVWVTQDHVPGTQISMWSMAHQDYLQTWIEFGWLGSLAFGVILFGGLAHGLARSWQSTDVSAMGVHSIWQE